MKMSARKSSNQVVRFQLPAIELFGKNKLKKENMNVTTEKILTVLTMVGTPATPILKVVIGN